jgi:hypothetical protein
MATTPPDNFRHTRRARRGSIYAVVLAMAILVSLIGLSAVAVGRINLRSAAAGGDGSAAELLAFSGIEHATTVLNTDSTWRSTYADNTETPQLRLGGGSFTWKVLYADPTLPASALQPVRVVGYGRSGDAIRRYSVRLLPKGTNILINGDQESGLTGWAARGTATLESQDISPYAHAGTRYLKVLGRASRTDGPAQVVTGKIVSGRTYFFEAWMRRLVGSDEPLVYLTVNKAGVETPFKFRGVSIPDTTWVKVMGTLTPSWTGTADSILFHVETAVDNKELLLDDVRLVEFMPTTPLAPDLGSWKQEDTTASTF